MTLQHFFFQEEYLSDIFLITQKQKEEIRYENYRIDPFRSVETFPFPASYWITLQKNGLEIEVNDEDLYKRVTKGQKIQLKYKKTYWKIWNKELFTGYQILANP